MDTRRIITISKLITEDPDIFDMDLEIENQKDEKQELEQQRRQEQEQEQLEREKKDKIINPQIDNIEQSLDNIGDETESIQNLDNQIDQLSLLLKRFGNSF